MQILEAQAKYLHKRVCHMATGLIFEVVDLVELGLLSKDRILFIFGEPEVEEAPLCLPSRANLREIETHYRLVS